MFSEKSSKGLHFSCADRNVQACNEVCNATDGSVAACCQSHGFNSGRCSDECNYANPCAMCQGGPSISSERAHFVHKYYCAIQYFAKINKLIFLKFDTFKSIFKIPKKLTNWLGSKRISFQLKIEKCPQRHFSIFQHNTFY